MNQPNQPLSPNQPEQPGEFNFDGFLDPGSYLVAGGERYHFDQVLGLQIWDRELKYWRTPKSFEFANFNNNFENSQEAAHRHKS